MKANYNKDIWWEDKNKMMEEFCYKFGYQIDMEKLMNEWEK